MSINWWFWQTGHFHQHFLHLHQFWCRFCFSWILLPLFREPNVNASFFLFEVISQLKLVKKFSFQKFDYARRLNAKFALQKAQKLQRIDFLCEKLVICSFRVRGFYGVVHEKISNCLNFHQKVVPWVVQDLVVCRRRQWIFGVNLRQI